VPACRPDSPKFRDAAARLREVFDVCGCLRVPIETRIQHENRQAYKHGYELRFGARDRSELREIQGLLRVVGAEPGRPYLKHGLPIVPIYGRQRVLRAIRDLQLERPKVVALSRHAAPGARAPARLPFKTVGQLVVAMRMYDRCPMTARRIGTSAALLVRLARRRLVRPTNERSGVEKTWVLTPSGKEQTRRGRRANIAWLRSGRQGSPLEHQWST